MNLFTPLNNLEQGGKFIHPIGEVPGGQNINPIFDLFRLLVNIQPMIESMGIKNVQPISNFPVQTMTPRMANPDYTGQYGFPEKPTGYGGLRPVGPLGGTSEGEQVDPGEISIFKQFGNKGNALLGNLLGELLKNNPGLMRYFVEKNSDPHNPSSGNMENF